MTSPEWTKNMNETYLWTKNMNENYLVIDGTIITELHTKLWWCIAMCHLHGMISQTEYEKAKKRYIKEYYDQ